MRKYRSWLMGLGIGLILGASMLQLVLAAKNQSNSLSLTREQLEEEASKSGFVVYPVDERIYTEEELQAKLEEAAKAKEQPAAGTDQSKAKVTTDESNAAKPQDQSDEQKDTSTPDTEVSASPSAPVAEDPAVATLYIRPGMTLTEVANKLEQLGVVDDAADFLDKCFSIASDLEIGTSVFTGKPTYRSIMTELTRVKP
jgi:hypothetical protein